MNVCIRTVAFTGVLIFSSAAAVADDAEGIIESVDQGGQSITVEGTTYSATEETEYEDGLTRFGDLKRRQRVEVDYEERDASATPPNDD